MTTFTEALLPEIFATETFICPSEIFVKDTFTPLNKTLVVSDRCEPKMDIVSLSFPNDVLKDVIMG